MDIEDYLSQARGESPAWDANDCSPAERQKRFDWQKKYEPQILAILGQHLFVPSSPEEDYTRATDFVAIDAEQMRVASRLRRTTFESKYKHQIIFRSYNHAGGLTELQKLLRNPHLSYYFYGFAGDGKITRWVILRLVHFRMLFRGKGTWKQLEAEKVCGIIECKQKFVWIDLRMLPPECVLSSSHEIPRYQNRAQNMFV